MIHISSSHCGQTLEACGPNQVFSYETLRGVAWQEIFLLATRADTCHRYLSPGASRARDVQLNRFHACQDFPLSAQTCNPPGRNIRLDAVATSRGEVAIMGNGPGGSRMPLLFVSDHLKRREVFPSIQTSNRLPVPTTQCQDKKYSGAH